MLWRHQCCTHDALLGNPLAYGVNTHYEILGRRGSGWTILEVQKDRDTATKTAEQLWKSRKYNGVRVLKESFDQAENDVTSIEIYARGSNRKKSKYDETGTISPCLTPDDLYSHDGRRSIWDLMNASLAEWRITPTELLHSLDHYYRLYNAGTRLQNAVQRTAVAFENEEGSIQERMRKIYKVIDLSIEIMKSTKDDVPSLETGRLAPIIAELEGKPNKKFLLTCAIVEYLRPAITLSDKIGRVIIFLTANRPAWVMEILDQLISEYLVHEHVLFQLMGEKEDRATFMIELAYFQSGELNLMGEDEKSPRFSEEVLRLNGFLAENMLPRSSHVMLDRLKDEIEAPKPIGGGSLIEQLRGLSAIGSTLESLHDDFHALDHVMKGVRDRAGRLINSQSIAEMLSSEQNPIDQINRLLDLEAVTIGDSNKRVIANFILPILSRPEYESVFMGLDQNPMHRMSDLVLLQKRILDASLSEMYKRKIASQLDQFCQIIMDNTQVLKRIHQLDITLQAKSQKILKMLSENYFTDGSCRVSAEHQVRVYMRQPGFTEGLIKGLKRKDAEAELLAFKQLLERANLNQPGEQEHSDEDAHDPDGDPNAGSETLPEDDNTGDDNTGEKELGLQK